MLAILTVLPALGGPRVHATKGTGKPRGRPPMVELWSLNRRIATPRAIYRDLRSLNIDLINAIAFAHLTDDQRKALVPAEFRGLLRIHSVDQVHDSMQRLHQHLLEPETKRSTGNKALRKQAITFVTEGIALIEQNRAVTTRAKLWAAANRVDKEFFQVQEQKLRRYGKRKAQKGFAGRDLKTGKFEIYLGHFYLEQVGPWNVPISKKGRPRLDTRYEAYRLIDHVLDTEYGYGVETPEHIAVLEAAAQNLLQLRDQQRQDPEHFKAPEATLAQITDSLFGIAPGLRSVFIVERQLTQKATVSASILALNDHFGPAHSQVSQAHVWQQTRLASVKAMIDALHSTRAKMRKFSAKEIAFFNQRIGWASTAFPRIAVPDKFRSDRADAFEAHITALYERVRGSKEPDHALVEAACLLSGAAHRQWRKDRQRAARAQRKALDARSELRNAQGEGNSRTAQARRRQLEKLVERYDTAHVKAKEAKDKAVKSWTVAKEAFSDLKSRIHLADKLFDFMKDYRDRFGKLRLSPMEEEQAQRLAFHEAFEQFVTKEQQTKDPHSFARRLPHARDLWWIKFYQTVHVSPKIDNPKRKDPNIPPQQRKHIIPRRIPNDVFRAFNLYFEMAHRNDIDAILSDRYISRRVKKDTRANKDTRVWAYLQRMRHAGKQRLFPRSKQDELALDHTERVGLEQALAEQYGVAFKEIASARRLYEQGPKSGGTTTP